MNVKRFARALLFCPLLLLLLQTTAWAQSKTVTGTVTDDKNAPVQGASVLATGTTIGTQTDASGKFSLNVPSSAKSLTISYVGYAAQEIPIGGTNNITVRLSGENQSNLNEVVVIGYGTARKKDLTGSVASVSSKDFNKGVVSSPDQLLQGKVAGLEITNTSGQPGGTTVVKIRGNNSIRGGTTPLYVVDGVPLDGRFPRPSLGSVSGLGNLPDANPLIYLNPAEIASVDVLKDASAAAIYGSRGANGVIIITTKKGQAGTTKVEAAASYGFSNLMKKADVLSASQYRSELAKYGIASDSGLSLNPFKEILRTAITQNYNLALSGGNENGRFRGSFLASDQQGLVKKSDLKKFIGNFNGQYKFLKQKLSFDFNVTASNVGEHIAPISNDAGSTGNLISAAMNWNPTLRLVNSDGSYNQANPSGQINPLALSDYYNDISNVTSLLANISAGYKITPDLEYRLLYGVNYGAGSRNAELLGFIIGTGANPGGNVEVANAQLLTQTLTHTLHFNKNVSTDLNLDAIVGYEYWTTSYKSNLLTDYGFDYNIPGGNKYNIHYWNNLQDGNQANLRVSSSKDPSVELQSYFGRVGLNFKDKYLFTGTFRADGSSRFGANNKYAYFPSAAFAWNLANENFMKNSTVFNSLKLRIGYGETGSQDGIPSGASKELYTPSGFGGNTSIANFANNNLKWEKVTSTDAGIDFSFLHGRVYGYLDGFLKKTTNVLFLTPAIVPGTTTTGVWENLNNAYITNKGIELSVGAAIVHGKDFGWNLNLNLEYVRNKFVDPSLGASPLYLTGGIAGQGVSNTFAQALANGQPIDVYYLRKFTGFDKNGIAQVESQASSYQGDPNPHVIAGFSTDFSYKKFSLTINAHGAFGNKIYNNTLNSVTNLGNIANGKNISKTLIGSSESLANPVSASTRFLQSGNYTKLGNATLGYNVGNLGSVIKDFRVYVSGTNLFAITKYTGFDPEVSTDHGNNGVPSLGIDYIGYPTPRTFTFGLNFSL